MGADDDAPVTQPLNAVTVLLASAARFVTATLPRRPVPTPTPTPTGTGAGSAPVQNVLIGHLTLAVGSSGAQLPPNAR